ncbi:hypothetical protein K504DRAFT_464075 [Pleomassaria siparia CBS 279.74]|uniref:Uncharacterized protein n=1 Tax=Pleomassaria siparia CBS 279.74 TaxID=1314801 RepID=A0A6G1KGE7_9PLEO|nr:hypothetical protein K504DRAFT_464075 [Pleomassaria siparia CBS 279.74]
MGPTKKLIHALHSPISRPQTPPDEALDDSFSDSAYFSSPATTSPNSQVQNALFSCLSHFEYLILAAQPSEEQMEQILFYLEEVARILSALEAQSRKSNDHFCVHGEGETRLVAGSASFDTSSIHSSPPRMHDSAYYSSYEGHTGIGPDVASEKYVAAVQSYIEGVMEHTKGLKRRMEEIKELNCIQTEIIKDLREQLRAEKEATKAQPTQMEEDMAEKTERTGFWTAVGEALDQVGDMTWEW